MLNWNMCSAALNATDCSMRSRKLSMRLPVSATKPSTNLGGSPQHYDLLRRRMHLMRPGAELLGHKEFVVSSEPPRRPRRQLFHQPAKAWSYARLRASYLDSRLTIEHKTGAFESPPRGIIGDSE